MDWRLTAALTMLTGAAGLLTFEGVALMRSAPDEVRQVPRAPLLLIERRPEFSVSKAPEPPIVTSDAVGSIAPESIEVRRAPERIAIPVEQKSAARLGHKSRIEPLQRPASETGGKTAPAPDARKAVQPDAAAPAKPALAHPHPEPPKPDHRYDGVLTAAEIVRIKTALRLNAEQELHWRPVEAELRDIGRQQIAQVHSGKKPEVGYAAAQRLYWAARPLLAILRPEQKEHVRKLARSVGYDSVASLI